MVVGSTTAGTTALDINNVGSAGVGYFTGTGATDGLKLVEVAGASLGDFTAAPITVGAYEFNLNKADGQSFYLQSDISSSALGLSSIGAGLFGSMETMDQRRVQPARGGPRVPERLLRRAHTLVPTSYSQPVFFNAAPRPIARPIPRPIPQQPVAAPTRLPRKSYSTSWATYSHELVDAHTTSSVSDSTITNISAGDLDSMRQHLRVGRDFVMLPPGLRGGSIVLSANYQYSNIDFDFARAVVAPATAIPTSTNFKGHGAGAELVLFSPGGSYFSLRGEWNELDGDVNDGTAKIASPSATTQLVSAEAGYKFRLKSGLAFVPQLQAQRERIAIEDFVSASLPYSFDASTNDTLRAGLSIEYSAPKLSRWSSFLKGNFIYARQDGGAAKVGTTAIKTRFDSQQRAEVQAGVNMAFADQRSGLYANVAYAMGLDEDYKRLRASGGVRLRF